MATLAFETVFSMIESSAMPVVDRIRQLHQDRRWSNVELGERVGGIKNKCPPTSAGAICCPPRC